MARRALNHKGTVAISLYESVKVHSLFSLGTWLLMCCTAFLIVPYWIISPTMVLMERRVR